MLTFGIGYRRHMLTFKWAEYVHGAWYDMYGLLLEFPCFHTDGHVVFAIQGRKHA